MKWEEKNNLSIFRIIIALIFLSAGVMRLFNIDLAKQEVIALGLPVFSYIIIVLVEIIGGILLLFNKYIRIVLSVFVAEILGALLLSMLTKGSMLLSSLKNLFIFNVTATD